MEIVLVGPGRIGEALEARLRVQGHGVQILSRRAYGDFLAPAYDPAPAVSRVAACDAVLLLAGRFELNGREEALAQTNVTGPLRVAEALHARFPQAQTVAFLDSRIRRPLAVVPPEVRAYLAAKKRLANWVLGAAKAWGRATGARVNAIAPGPVLPPPDQAHREKGGACLTPRPTIEDIARAVQFLLETPSVTGQILYVAAGQQLL